MIFTSDDSVNIMFHGLINPCIHLIESNQLYKVGAVNNKQLQVFIDFVPQTPLSAQRLPLLI
jgi:hypothetical protein